MQQPRKETIQIFIMVFLILGLLLSIGILIWLSFPQPQPNDRESNVSADKTESENNNLVKGSMVVKLKGSFKSKPKSNSSIAFKTDQGEIKVKIPRDFPRNFKMDFSEVTAHYLGLSNKTREFQLLSYRSLETNEAWTSSVRPKPRIKSSSWYYF